MLVLERKAHTGGCLQTLPGPDGFWVEAGGHTLYNSYKGVLEILDELSLKASICKRKRQPYKIQEASVLRTAMSYIRWKELIGSLWASRGMGRENQTIQEFWSAKIGVKNYQAWFGKILSAVPCQRADSIPAAMLFRIRPRRPNVPRSYTLVNGLQSLARALEKKSRFTTLCEVAVNTLGYSQNKGWVVHGAKGREEVKWEAPHLALAIDSSATAVLLQKDFPEFSKEVAKIKTMEVRSWAGVVSTDRCLLPRLAGIIPLDLPVYSLVSRDVLPHKNYRGFALHFAGEAGEQDLESLISAMTKVCSGAWTEQKFTTHTLPKLESKHLQIAQSLSAALPKLAHGSLAISGNWMQGLSIEECVQRSKAEAERLLSCPCKL